MTEPAHTPTLGAAVTGYGTAAVPLAGVDALRPKLGSVGGKPVPLKIVKYSDEQTVAGMSAVLQAVAWNGWGERSFRDWSAVGAPRYLGRMAVALSVARYLQDHAYSVSPNIIPNQSLHATSGTLSLVLSIQGPHFGVGGGPNAVAEGLLTALNVLYEYRLPGVWLVATEFEPEPIPDENGSCRNASEVTAYAVALALENVEGAGCLRLSPTPDHGPPVTVRQLHDYLSMPRSTPWRCPVDGLGTMELTVTISQHR